MTKDKKLSKWAIPWKELAILIFGILIGVLL